MTLTSDKFRWRHVGTKLRSQMKAAGLLNGCGPKGGWIGALVPNAVFGLDVEEFCDWHDFNYLIGGKEADRVKADWQFYEAIRERAKELTSGWKVWLRPLYLVTAWAYYQAVRAKGGPHFRYGDPLGKPEVLELLRKAELEKGLAG